jgi:hypothetical protein
MQGSSSSGVTIPLVPGRVLFCLRIACRRVGMLPCAQVRGHPLVPVTALAGLLGPQAVSPWLSWGFVRAHPRDARGDDVGITA